MELKNYPERRDTSSSREMKVKPDLCLKKPLFPDHDPVSEQQQQHEDDRTTFLQRHRHSLLQAGIGLMCIPCLRTRSNLCVAILTFSLLVLYQLTVAEARLLWEMALSHYFDAEDLSLGVCLWGSVNPPVRLIKIKKLTKRKRGGKRVGMWNLNGISNVV